MNNTFNIKRFGLVMRKDFQENWKKYALQFLAMFGIIALVLCLQSNSRYRGGFLEGIDSELLFLVSAMFLGFGVVFASTFTEPMRSKIKRGMYLMNPASILEKYLSRWIIVTIGYIIAFFVAFWFADLIRVAIYSVSYPEIDVHMLDFGKLITNNGLFESNSEFAIAVGVFFFLQSICVLGSTFWEKASFVKTFAASVIIVLLFFLLADWTISIFYADYSQFSNVTDSIFGSGKITDDEIYIIIAGIFMFSALVSWTIAFFRFRESEIIKRW
jgi:hypothetical protein